MAKKSKKRRAWTATEVRELKTMARKKTAAPKIAKKLKRTTGGSVRSSPARGGHSISAWSLAFDET
jgi:hypothetical protein